DYVCMPQYGVARVPPSFPTRRSSDLSSVDGTMRAGLGRLVPVIAWVGYILTYPYIGDALGQYAGIVGLLPVAASGVAWGVAGGVDRKSTRLNSSHVKVSYAVFCLTKK